MSRRRERSSLNPCRTSANGRGRMADERKDAGVSEATAMVAENITGPGPDRAWLPAPWAPAPPAPPLLRRPRAGGLRTVGRAGRSVARRVTRLQPLAYLDPPRRPPGTRPVVGVVGFYGHGNYGDELFLEVFREHLGASFDLRSIIDPANRTLVRLLGSGVRETEAILIGGGDILKPWPNGSRYWERAYLRRPVFVAGIGVPAGRPAVPGAGG